MRPRTRGSRSTPHVHVPDPGVPPPAGAGRKGRQLSKRSGGFVSIGLVLTLAGSMAATLLGGGAASRAFDVSDGNTWLWSSKPGSVSRVNANSGRVDMRQPFIDARGHQVRVSQNDKFLILHDLDTGRITSVDLTRMSFSGTVTLGQGTDVRVALHGDTAVIVDRAKGLIRGLDPATLRVTTEVTRVVAPLVGGVFDEDGTLWVGTGQGTVLGFGVDGDRIIRRRAETVAEPGHKLALSVLDHGALAVNRDASQLTLLAFEDKIQLPVSGSLADAVVPERTVGDLLAVTMPASKSVLAYRQEEPDSAPVRVSASQQGEVGAAVPFSERLYVPDPKAQAVVVYSANGKRIDTVSLPGSGNGIELEVREERLFVNAPNSNSARVISPNGAVKKVDKYRDDVLGGGNSPAGQARPAPNPNPAPGGEGPEKTGPPGPPVPVTAVAGDNEVRLTWGRSAKNGAPVSKYTITWNGGSVEVPGDRRRSTVIGDLVNGESYTFRVVATNAHGTSPPAVSEAVTPSDHIPPVPQRVRAEADPAGHVNVTWPAVDGARDYVVQPSNDARAMQVTSPHAEVSGLTYGESYTFTVVARNDSGAGGVESAASNAVSPYTKPSVPGDVAAKGVGSGVVEVTWKPSQKNGADITGYTVEAANGKTATAAPGARSVRVTGLPNGDELTFRVTARNKAGDSDPATTPKTLVGTAPTVKAGAPKSDYTSITVRVNVTNDGGIKPDKCRLKIGAKTKEGACGTDLTINGLGANDSFDYKVDAHNKAGWSDAVGAKVDTKRLVGRVTCKNGPSGDQRTYCNNGVGTYNNPTQTSTSVGRQHNGDRLAPVCKVKGQFREAFVYNNNKESSWWVRLPNGAYLPYIWINLDDGDHINNLKDC